MKYLLPFLIFVLSPLFISAQETDFNVVNPHDGAFLAGTLALPPSEPRAVIVLASGSGQQDRDESAFGQRPFKTLSDSLALAGYAVLRMDDRGVGQSTGDYLVSYTTDTYVTDIRAALASLDSIFPHLPKGVIGHSEGGTVAVKIAASPDPCDFIVTLAGPAWPGDSIIMSQGRALSVALTGKWDGEAVQRRFLDIVKSPVSSLVAYPQLWALFTETLGDAVKFPEVSANLTEQIRVALSPWYRETVRYNPSDDIRAISIPWLALNGDKDIQILPGNLTTIAQLNPTAETMLLPHHNHMFQQTSTGLITDYPKDGVSPTPLTIALIVDWLDKTLTSQDIREKIKTSAD